MKLKRLLYLAYYFKNMDFGTLSRFMTYVSEKAEVSKAALWVRMLRDSVQYNISPLEYFQFGFYEKTVDEKVKWAGTGTMYEYQRIMNPVDARSILADKREFGKAYKDFILHQTSSLDDLNADKELCERIINNRSEKLVFKVADGKCGRNVKIMACDGLTPQSLTDYMKREGYDLVEEFVEQHKEMSRLSPSAVNTVRIITQLAAQGKVDILGCRQRISVSSPVDNMAAGNIAAAIDGETGVIVGKGYYSDITKPPVDRHPVTGVEISGFQVPFWQKILKLVKAAALAHPENRSVGWDVVVTADGPGLIEGNHDWCKLVWQLPVQKGLKPVLDRYLSEHHEAQEGA